MIKDYGCGEDAKRDAQFEIEQAIPDFLEGHDLAEDYYGKVQLCDDCDSPMVLGDRDAEDGSGAYQYAKCVNPEC